jgi:hypothetical protein
MLEQVENGRLIQDTKMDIIQAIQFVVKSWEEITTAESIHNCWHHTKILPNTNRMEMDLTDDPTVGEMINKLHLSNPMQVNEFLFIPERILYMIFQTITSLFKKSQRHLKKTLMRFLL